MPQTWPTPTYYSLSLNGSTAYIDVPDPASGGVPLDITGAVTVEGWVKTTSTARQGIVERYNNSACTGTSDGGYALRILKTSGLVRFLTLKNGCEFDSVDSSVAVTNGAWHHVAGVFTGNQLLIFVDGTLSGSKSSSFAPGTGTSHLTIGRGADGGGYFSGLMDEVRVTANAVYSGSFTPQHRVTGVVLTRGLWRFDNWRSDDTSRLGWDCAQVNNGSIVGGATSSTDVP